MTDNENRLTLPVWLRVLMPHGNVEEMKLETYLAGAIAAELGISAPLEALKAQAVASRTYVVSARRHPGHDADVCATAHCQKWTRVDPVSAPLVFRALTETWGMVAAYETKLIQAFFFEHCDGHTRNAEAMLMPASPYLCGVSCPCGFLTLKGHGVGMCMRGAIVMARRGASFEQILSHYYRGVAVIRIEPADHLAPEREKIKPPHVSAPTKKPRASKKPATSPVKKTKAETQPSPRLVRKPVVPAIPIEPVAPITEPNILVEPVHIQEPGSIEMMSPVVQPVEPEKKIDEPMVNAPVPPVKIVTIAELLEQTADLAPTESTQEILTSAHVLQPAQSGVPVIDEMNLPALEEAAVGMGKQMHVDHLPGTRMIAGTLPRIGVAITIYDARGAQTVVFSGSAPHYGEGGFETIVAENGTYLVSIDGHLFEVRVHDETVFIHAD